MKNNDKTCIPTWNIHAHKRLFAEKKRTYIEFVHGLCMCIIYGAICRQTDSVYGGRTKVRCNLKINICVPYTELYDCRIRLYNTMYGRIRLYTTNDYRSLDISNWQRKAGVGKSKKRNIDTVFRNFIWLPSTIFAYILDSCPLLKNLYRIALIVPVQE